MLFQPYIHVGLKKSFYPLLPSMFHPAAPSSPARNSSVEATTATSVSLSWDPPADDQRNGIITSYVIRVLLVDRGTTEYYNSSITSVTLTSLKPYTTYECSVAAVTSAGRGPFSSAITVQTDEAGMQLNTNMHMNVTMCTVSLQLQVALHRI